MALRQRGQRAFDPRARPPAQVARGDSGTGDLTEPSAGVWASTKRPDDILDNHSGHAAVVIHAHPSEIRERRVPLACHEEGPDLGRRSGSEWARATTT